MDEIIGPWKRSGSRVVYDNGWVRVRHDEVITPAGERGVYGVIETADALGCVPLTEDLQVYLVGQHRYPHDQYSWELPEGGRHDGETIEAGVLRELKEETGLIAGQLTELGTIHTSNCFTDETAYLFLAEDLVQGPSSPDATEELAVRLVSFPDAMTMVERGDIQDAMTVVALYRTRDVLRDRGLVT